MEWSIQTASRLSLVSSPDPPSEPWLKFWRRRTLVPVATLAKLLWSIGTGRWSQTLLQRNWAAQSPCRPRLSRIVQRSWWAENLITQMSFPCAACKWLIELHLTYERMHGYNTLVNQLTTRVIIGEDMLVTRVSWHTSLQYKLWRCKWCITWCMLPSDHSI